MCHALCCTIQRSGLLLFTKIFIVKGQGCTIFKSGDCEGHPNLNLILLWVIHSWYWGMFWIIVFPTCAGTLASRNCWYFVEPILACPHTTFPVLCSNVFLRMYLWWLSSIFTSPVIQDVVPKSIQPLEYVYATPVSLELSLVVQVLLH